MHNGSPKLYLHIGRNKAGSTTLQDYFLQHWKTMRKAGMQYVLFGQSTPDGSLPPTASNHFELADVVHAQPGGAVLVSHEGLCCFTPDLTQVMAAHLAGMNVQLIFYVRPYGAWAVSSYCFDVRVGLNGRNFDRYLDLLQPRLSFWPMLEVWGRTIGWDRVRVRSLHPADLQGGDLITDCLSAIGLPPPADRPSSRANTSPGWVAVELLRLAVARDTASGWDKPGQAVAEALHELADQAVEACGVPCPTGGYLTLQQAGALAAHYNSDLARLAAHAGVNLQPDHPLQTRERAAVPSADQVPACVLQMIRTLALAPDYARLHPEAAAFMSAPAFRALCGE